MTPFTALYTLITKHCTHMLNTQNSVLKVLSFVFEHTGTIRKDCVYVVTLLLEDALVDYNTLEWG